MSLCARIVEETDPDAFNELIEELNVLLDQVLGPNPGKQ